ncbi:DUF6887 family protein [Anabaena azotica]|uniref:Uncharacterized protein n=1 Tax=Anabaena azotica FACHB-119 TaxID=947527 RepID=A0ABR8DBW9_9NOST|nr:hypothetical protein [Anabaena azotica]MBD2504124.1 hypothetical protein [Anabaena azotica FACHB-119]
MSQIDYAAMSDEELRRYFLQHRDDKIALRVYLDRLNEGQHEMITTVEDPNFDAKIQAAILRKMQIADSNGEANF